MSVVSRRRFEEEGSAEVEPRLAPAGAVKVMLAFGWVLEAELNQMRLWEMEGLPRRLLEAVEVDLGGIATDPSLISDSALKAPDLIIGYGVNG